MPRTLSDLLEDRPPASALTVGDAAALAVAAFLDAHPEIERRRLPATEAISELPSLGVQDLAVVSDLEQMSHAEAGILLGQLRDLYARQVLVLLDAEDVWTHKDMIGHGYSRVADTVADDYTLYRFDIADYKTTPDWLNDRYWANPELFDKYRW